MLRQPKILFLDEATSALDTQSEALVQQALDALIATKDSTICLVAHRLSTVRDANKICVLGEGKIQEQGTHDELLRNDGPYARLVSRQITKDKNEILGDGAFDASEAAAAAEGAEPASEAEPDAPGAEGDDVLSAWLKTAPDVLRGSAAFTDAVQKAAVAARQRKAPTSR